MAGSVLGNNISSRNNIVICWMDGWVIPAKSPFPFFGPTNRSLKPARFINRLLERNSSRLQQVKVLLLRWRTQILPAASKNFRSSQSADSVTVSLLWVWLVIKGTFLRMAICRAQCGRLTIHTDEINAPLLFSTQWNNNARRDVHAAL